MKITSLFCVVLIFLVLMKADKLAIALCNPRRKEFDLVFTDKSLVGPVLGSFTAMGEMVCQYNCHSHDFCHMYNFNPDTGRCEILDARASSFKVEIRKNWILRAQKCGKDPCKNGGFCYFANGGDRCMCTCGWSGEICDVPTTSTDSVLFFPGGSISDLVAMVNPFPTSLTALTVSMWVQIDPSHYQHTPFSYGTQKEENVIYVSIMPGKTWVYINFEFSEFTAPDLLIVDGVWHQLSFTWESSSGKVIFYIDGIRKGEKNSVATGQTIEGMGALVLGQDQDSYMGGYNSKQAYQGNLTSFNMWDRALTASEVSVLASKCPTEEGNIVQWSQLMSLPKSGSVKLICSHFCIP